MSEHIDHSAKVSIDHCDDNDEAYELIRDLRNEQVVRAKSTAKKVQLKRSLENKIKEIIKRILMDGSTSSASQTVKRRKNMKDF